MDVYVVLTLNACPRLADRRVTVLNYILHSTTYYARLCLVCWVYAMPDSLVTFFLTSITPSVSLQYSSEKTSWDIHYVF